MMDDGKLELASEMAAKLATLLADPHPGLTTWWDAVRMVKMRLDNAMTD